MEFCSSLLPNSTNHPDDDVQCLMPSAEDRAAKKPACFRLQAVDVTSHLSCLVSLIAKKKQVALCFDCLLAASIMVLLLGD